MATNFKRTVKCFFIVILAVIAIFMVFCESETASFAEIALIKVAGIGLAMYLLGGKGYFRELRKSFFHFVG